MEKCGEKELDNESIFEESKNKEHYCDNCKKNYSSKQSLLNHRKTFHLNLITKLKDEINDRYPCRHCEGDYKSYQSRWNHEKKCILVDKKHNKIQNTSKEIEKLKDEKLKQQQQIIKLQQKLLKNNSLDTKTFRALNKILIERSMNNSNNTTNSHNTANNTIINNNIKQICNVGSEDICGVLSQRQKQLIFSRPSQSIEKIVEITHCGEYNQFKNIIITNLKDNFAYQYDDKKGFFVAVDKNKLIDNVVTLRLTDIEAIYDELNDANKIDDKTKRIIQQFLDRFNSEEPFTDEHDNEYPNFKSFKKNNIKILLYNNRDKITKDIALLISDVGDFADTPPEKIQL
jgi:hypothetical protein